jgi:hypothetical protein
MDAVTRVQGANHVSRADRPGHQSRPRRRINEEARRNPQSPYAQKFVGIANGQVAVVADSWDQMSRQLRQIEPDPTKCYALEASRDPDEVHEIWGLD